MALSPQQQQRLRSSMRGLRRSPDFSTIKQFITAESAQDKPDYGALKRLIMDAMSEHLDGEIEGAKERRKRAVGLP